MISGDPWGLTEGWLTLFVHVTKSIFFLVLKGSLRFRYKQASTKPVCWHHEVNLFSEKLGNFALSVGYTFTADWTHVLLEKKLDIVACDWFFEDERRGESEKEPLEHRKFPRFNFFVLNLACLEFRLFPLSSITSKPAGYWLLRNNTTGLPVLWRSVTVRTFPSLPYKTVFFFSGRPMYTLVIKVIYYKIWFSDLVAKW